VLFTSILPPYSETVVLLIARLRPTPLTFAWAEPGGAHSPFAEKKGEKPVNPHLLRARVRTHIELKLVREKLESQNEVLEENARLREEVAI
jgi:hypothetical protein